MRARLRGEACFRRLDRDALACTEEGVLTLANGARLRAVRRYVYRRDGDALLVEFADGPDAGRRYVRLDVAHGGDDAAGIDAAAKCWRATDRHLCGRDLYQADYRFHGFDERPEARRIVQRTRVEGPRKAYAIVTLLRPLSRDVG